MALIPFALPVSPMVLRDGWYPIHAGVQHQGMDFAVAMGSPVYAIAPGVVVVTTDDHSTAGGSVVIMHTGPHAGLWSRYLHLSKRLVKRGDGISTGKLIGLSGGEPGTYGAGLSGAAHLHFDMQATSAAIKSMKQRGLLKSGRKGSGTQGYNIPVEQFIPGTGDPTKWPMLGTKAGGELMPIALAAGVVLILI